MYIYIHVCMYPPTEEIRPQIFGSLDYPVCLDSILSDGDSVYLIKTCLKC